MSAASMIATHLNVPHGRMVSAHDFASSLRSGRLSASTKEANAILSALFTETAPRLILRCAREEGASLEATMQLYQETLTQGEMGSPEWESAMQGLLRETSARPDTNHSHLPSETDRPKSLQSRL